MTLDAIKEAIGALSDEDRHDLVAWINGLEYDEWDMEMVRDFSPGGRGEALVERVKREIAEGKTTPIEGGLEQSRPKRNRPRP